MLIRIIILRIIIVKESNKDKNIWFQDFIIDKTSWNKQNKKTVVKKEEEEIK